MKDTILNNLRIVRQRIENACIKSHRVSHDVQLLLATKTVSADKISVALEAGETLIGENKVQELTEKFAALRATPHQTHFIGHLQSNKIKEVLKYADCIQSVDSLALVGKLQKQLEAEDKSVAIFIQVNTSREQSKFGIDPTNALEFALQLQQFERIRLKGLMTIGLFSAETERVRACYQLLRRIQHQLLQKDIPAFELSMGMSGDIETAIEEGATIIRVGTAVFGSRSYPDSFYWNENIAR